MNPTSEDPSPDLGEQIKAAYADWREAMLEQYPNTRVRESIKEPVSSADTGRFIAIVVTMDTTHIQAMVHAIWSAEANLATGAMQITSHEFTEPDGVPAAKLPEPFRSLALSKGSETIALCLPTQEGSTR
jgi:hypothetical protein